MENDLEFLPFSPRLTEDSLLTFVSQILDDSPGFEAGIFWDRTSENNSLKKPVKKSKRKGCSGLPMGLDFSRKTFTF